MKHGNIDIEQDDAARKVATKYVEEGVQVPLHKVQFYAAYMQGMREAYLKLFPKLIASAKKAEKPYLEAEYKLLTSCINACYDYHTEKYEIRYKDFVNDSKGRIVSCTAYFARKTEIITEVKYE